MGTWPTLLHRLALCVIAVPALAIVIDTLFILFSADPENMIVGTVHRLFELASYDPLGTMFADQEYYQTAALALIPWGVAALLTLGLFRLLRALDTGSSPATETPST